jgi:hypothetical protein
VNPWSNQQLGEKHQLKRRSSLKTPTPRRNLFYSNFKKDPEHRILITIKENHCFFNWFFFDFWFLILS